MFPQFTKLIAKVSFSLKLEGKGRPCVVKVGDIFLTTNASWSQNNGIKVDRKVKASINSGYMLTIEQIHALFDIVE